jgi:transcriptional regulator of acetoin/glycerol metabolism
MQQSTLTPEKVRAALIAGDGSPTKAALILKVSRQTVHTWMRKHAIRVERRVVHEAA